ncbi:spermidine/putrescine ABC transporter ATPase [Parageobacillus genomosp. 1]|uniref:Carnitine transport ATP-binding protein OpuCA n=1 Tax=Parageobacillus genomosp. 1 TaxID=1295642 RepID=A0ABC9VAQ8_9BACL|nr:ABC transporter ATP-binding protein [Parageobacillus genomosp. 1]EZP75196.1 spermidine/putrescine ABC transporter ATPase [Parageobacillus genomosp. 1]
MSFLTIDRVFKRYDDHVVLNDISLSLEKGEFATLLGQSGCGKSTLLRAIAGLVDIDSGNIILDGKDITHLSPRKREVGMVFQSYALFPNMTVFENISFGLKMKKETDNNIQSKVKQMIDLVNLNGKEDYYPHQLSGGQQQRVALARSLVMEPKVLLLDEPLSALDAKIRKNLQAELKRIQRELKITTIFVTHDQEEAMTMSDTIYIMNEGRIVQAGTPSEIYTSPNSPFVANFIGNYNVLPMEKFQRLIQENIPFPGSQVAIRPEVIEILEDDHPSLFSEDHWIIKGTIQDIWMTGNVLRYDIQAEDITLRVDHLHQQRHVFHPGSHVYISIPKSECIVL